MYNFKMMLTMLHSLQFMLQLLQFNLTSNFPLEYIRGIHMGILIIHFSLSNDEICVIT